MATGKGLADPVSGSAPAPASDNLDQDVRLPGPRVQAGEEEHAEVQADCDEDTVEDDHASPPFEISERISGIDSGQDRRQDSSSEANAPSVPSSQDADNASEDGSVTEDTNRPAQLKSTRRSSRHAQGTTVPARGKGRGRRRSCDANSEDESESQPNTGLRLGLRILQDLMNTNSMFHSYPEAKKGMVDYHDIIEKPMWFLEIQRKFEDDEYASIVDFVKDVRLLLLNTYRYFGRDALETRRALRIEHVLEMKLATLPKDLKNQCSLMSTNGIQSSTDEGSGHISRKSADFFSYLLESVAGDRADRGKNRTKVLEEGRQLDREGRGKETLQWEVKVLLAPPAITQMRTMWEIPLIGHLLQLTVQILCIEQVPQYEVERMFLMPQASKTLAVLMTSLLSPPHQRPKLHLIPPMPYTIWSRKLSQRVAIWYKMFQTRNRDWTKVFELCGIEKDFWAILGDWNQMEDYEFHELSFHQRVWLIKTLGDYLVHNHKTMQDALAEHSQKEQNCEFLGEDRHGRQYLHFPQFCSAPGLSTCVRVYRCVIPEEKARSPDITEEASRVEMRTDRGNFLPTWMKRRSQGKAKGIKSRQAMKKRLGAEINSRKFLSRIIYRMPNGMHIGGRRKRGTTRLAERYVNVQQEEEEFPKEISVSVLDSSTPSYEQPTGCPDKILLADSESSGMGLSRQTRSSRKISQGFYADWSDSDSLSTPSPSSSNSKSVLPSHSVSSSAKPSGSKSNCLKMKLRVCKKQSRATYLKNSDESRSGISDDEKTYKAFDPDEDVSSHESGCEEGGDRNSWSLHDSVKKEDDDSDEGGNNFRPENEEKEDCDVSLAEDFSWISSDKELVCKNKEKRPHFNPVGMLLGAEHFELVADSVQGVRDLVESLCEDDDDMDLSQRLKKRTMSYSTQPLCETNLEHRLLALISEIELLEVKMEKNTRQLRWKLFAEWKDFQNRPKDVTDDSESFWLSILEKGIENSIHEGSTETKEEETVDNPNNAASAEAEPEKHNNQNVDIQDDDSQTGGEIRHSLRAKRTKVDNPGSAWLCSDSEDESSDDDEDDAWVMPGRRKKKSSAGRSRKNQKDTRSDDETEDRANFKKVSDRSQGVAKNFSFESCGLKQEPIQAEEDTTQLFKESSKAKVNQKKMLPNKLTLDKEGNMFITLGCGTRVHLRKDEDGRIVVPEGHEGLSMISGKTLDQLLGSGKVVQNKKKKPSRPTKRSTTLFPASSHPPDIVQAKEWTPPVMNSAVPVKEIQKLRRAKEWTPPLDKELTSPLPATSSSSPIGSQLKTYANRKQLKDGNQKLNGPSNVAVVPLIKKASSADEVVVLSDGSDDSIEVIKEAEPKSSNPSGVPRIESVIGNATDSFAPKPLTNSVTMTPVIKSSTNSSTSKTNAWSPVISKSVSLEPAPSSGRVRSPGAPQVVITPAKNVVPRRNLQQTGVFNQPSPNQSFIPMNTIPMRQAQSQFVPVNQMVSVNNPFQPVAQVVGMGNQYVLASNPFPPMGNQYVMNTASAFQYVPVAPAPVPLPVSAFDVGLPPGLTGQIVLANGDNNQFSYAFKLDDGGLIFLSNEQVSRIRAANGGRLTTMVQFQTQ